MTRKIALAALIALGIAGTAPAAIAAKSSSAKGSSAGVVSLNYIGPRVGFSVDPDQAVLGGQMAVGFARDWTFNPSVEFGFGDHQTVTALNFDGEYHFRLQNSNWTPYLGAGLGVNFINFDNNASDTVTGLNIIIGTGVPTASGQRMFTELRLGAGDADVPELKGIFGWNFRL